VVEKTDWAWLAGVIDSEATVALVCAPRRNPQLRIQIYNSSDSILDKVARILHEAEIGYYERTDTRFARPGYSLAIGTAGCLALYEHVRPYMVRQVSRLDAGYWFLAPRYEGRRRVYWTDKDRDVWQQLRGALNAR
jgi:hypothetical protein